jgi:hypothetical protein
VDLPNGTRTVLVQSDSYNAVYVDGRVHDQAKPDYLDIETLARYVPGASIYWVPRDVYDDHVSGDGYPDLLSNFPLNRCEQIR